MASFFCLRCGVPIEAGCNFCPRCGTAVKSGASGESSTTRSTELAAADLPRNIAALLCYALLFVTGLLFLLIAPYNRDRFVRFHAFQSIFFFIALVVLMVFAIAAGLLLKGICPAPLGFMVQIFCQSAAMIAGGGLWMLLMYKAYSDEMFSLPLVGTLAARQA